MNASHSTKEIATYVQAVIEATVAEIRRVQLPDDLVAKHYDDHLKYLLAESRCPVAARLLSEADPLKVLPELWEADLSALRPDMQEAVRTEIYRLSAAVLNLM